MQIRIACAMDAYRLYVCQVAFSRPSPVLRGFVCVYSRIYSGLKEVSFKASKMYYLNPRPCRAFSITRPCRGVGGGCDPSWRFETKRRSASRKRPIDCSRRVLAVGGIFFDPRSTFDLVMAGQRSIFVEIDVF